MRQVRSIRLLSFAAVCAAAILSACLYGSGGGGSCAQRHEMPGHTPVWTYSDCGPFNTIWIQPSTLDTDSKLALGARDAGRGMVSFKYTGLHNRNFRLNTLTYGIYFLAEGFRGVDADWRWQAINIGNGYVRNELVSQRNDVVCPRGARGECVSTSPTLDLQYTDSTVTYQWDCQWNSDNFLLSCRVTKPGDATFNVTLTNDMLGPYQRLKYLGVGTKAFDGTAPSFDVTVTDFRVTFFE